MNEIFENLFPSDLLVKPFENNYDYLNEEFKRIEMLLNYYLCAKKNNDFIQLKKIALKNFSKADLFIKSRLDFNKKEFFVGEYIKTLYNLSPLEWFCFLIAVFTKLDEKYLKMFLQVENADTLTYGAILKLYFFESDVSEISDYYLVYNSLFKKMNSLCFENGELKIDNQLFKNIMSNGESEIDILGINLRLPEKSGSLVIREETAKKICGFINGSSESEAVYFHLHGEEGIGKKTLIYRVCDVLNKGFIYINLKECPVNSAGFFEFIMSAYREAFFNKSFICIGDFESILKNKELSENHINFMLKTASSFARIVFVLSDENSAVKRYLENFFCFELPIEDLTNEESFKIWKSELPKLNLGKDSDAQEMANKFTFTPKQIKNTILEAKRESVWHSSGQIDKSMICDAAHRQITSNLSDKATIIKKKHTWDELIMSKDQKEIIKRACDRIKYKHIVYDKWGMKNRILYGTGLSMLFTGPPGTGKTMAAGVVANELGLEIYKVDLSKVVSKYIGESEKNLCKVFNSAKKSNVILLFDEIDALFGKRTEVKDSHDKNANLETSYLLQKMEEYDGITIMTTNFIENIDQAFFRRLSYVVRFAFPDASSRKEIWRKMYPKETPLSKDIDFDFLADRFEISGGSIKNAALNSAFIAASESTKVGMKHVVKALEYEIGKQGKMVSKDDFGEYGYLL